MCALQRQWECGVGPHVLGAAAQQEGRVAHLCALDRRVGRVRSARCHRRPRHRGPEGDVRRFKRDFLHVLHLLQLRRNAPSARDTLPRHDRRPVIRHWLGAPQNIECTLHAAHAPCKRTACAPHAQVRHGPVGLPAGSKSGALLLRPSTAADPEPEHMLFWGAGTIHLSRSRNLSHWPVGVRCVTMTRPQST